MRNELHVSKISVHTTVYSMQYRKKINATLCVCVNCTFMATVHYEYTMAAVWQKK